MNLKIFRKNFLDIFRKRKYSINEQKNINARGALAETEPLGSNPHYLNRIIPAEGSTHINVTRRNITYDVL